MPELPATDAEIELLVRGLVAAKVGGVEGVGKVFAEPFFVSGKQQYVEKLGVENAEGDIEVRCLFVEFAGFEDMPKGCEDAPHYYLLYQLRAVQEFIAEREGGGSSAKDFAAFVMNLRAAFLTGRDLGYSGRLYHERLTQTRRVALEDDDYTGVFGHAAPFTLKVEVVPNG